MSQNCSQCGAPLDPGASACKFCGEKVVQQQANQQYNAQPQMQAAPQPTVIIQQAAQPQQVYVSGINPSWPIKNKIVAGVLAIFLGSIGVHKFYLGKIGSGIIYLLFCWTFIPGFIGFIEGISYLCSSDENFQLKNQVRIG